MDMGKLSLIGGAFSKDAACGQNSPNLRSWIIGRDVDLMSQPPALPARLDVFQNIIEEKNRAWINAGLLLDVSIDRLIRLARADQMACEAMTEAMKRKMNGAGAVAH